jgi:polyketide cyclase/dehydrase/lipid transport protein
MARATESKPSGPVDRLKVEAGGLVNALTDRALSKVQGKVEGATSRLTDFAEGGGGPGLMAAVTGARNAAEGKSPARSFLSAGVAGVKEKVKGMFGGGKGGGGRKKLKLTNIVEMIDVGVPVRVAYNQWTSFPDFPTFTKKVETVDRSREDETKLNWKAQVLWSHRTWEASIVDQRPDERIVWRSKGQKGHVDGTVTFHELGPSLTRIIVVLEYHPQGLFERTGNIWRAQGRRVRLELKHFQRHVMTNTALHPDDVEGWRGVIEDGEVVKSHEDALGEEGREPGDQRRGRRRRGGQADEENDGKSRSDERDSEMDADEGAGEEPEAESADEPEDEGETGADDNGQRRPAVRRSSRGSGNGSAGRGSRSGSGRGSGTRRAPARTTRGGDS